MRNARLMNNPEDFKRLGLSPDTIEMWEDGRRSTSEKGQWEWWYFDTILDDGTKVVIQFFPKSGAHLKFKGDFPMFLFRVTTPDGVEYKREPSFSTKEASWSKDKCAIKYANNYFEGDLKNYHIHVDPIDGLGADLYLESKSKPYRPGSGYFSFESDEDYFTWLCVVPKGEVHGTITINGEERKVHGFGYHDHQWGNQNFLQEWNNWVWARQSFEDYSLLLFDFVSAEKTGFTRFPIIFIEDNNGDIVFESHDKVKAEVLEEYVDPVSEKTYPKAIHYTFSNMGKTVDYTLKMDEVIECNGKNNLPKAKKLLAKLAGLDPAYSRYSAEGKLSLVEGDKTIERQGSLIYEFMYPGKTYKC